MDGSQQVNAIVAGAQNKRRRLQDRADILSGVLRSIEQFDTVAALIRSSEDAAAARTALMDLLGIDEVQARAVADMQVSRLASRERQALADEYDESVAGIADLDAILTSPERQQELVGTEWAARSVALILPVSLRSPGQ